MTKRQIAAYLLDRADQYETDSPVWIGLADAAANIMNGNVDEAIKHGELNDSSLLKRVDGFRNTITKTIR